MHYKDCPAEATTMSQMFLGTQTAALQPVSLVSKVLLGP
jgi:hypothetical protein